MTQEELSEQLETQFIAEVEASTLKEGLSMRDAAQICRDLASAFRQRAEGFEEEADGNEGDQ
jgi:3,4-dihydroxy-2-butanone 4-phosphate synthase